MFDYARRLQLAAKDTGRRAGMMAGAGVLALIALGYLMAAIWSFLAWNLHLGPTWASAILFVVIALAAGVMFMMGKTVRHPVPPTELLKREVEARVALASEAAMDMAKGKAREVVSLAEQKAVGLVDTVTYKAASLVDSAEAKAKSLARGTVDDTFATARSSVEAALGKVGLDGRTVDEVKTFVDDVKSSRAAPAIGILGALAVGYAVAQRFRPQEDEWEYVYEDEDV